MKKLIVFVLLNLTLFANDAIISPKWLHDNMEKKNLRIVEVSNEDSFKLKHIKNAVLTSIDKWRIPKDTFISIRPANEIEDEIRTLGIDNNTHVVIYAPITTPKDYLKASYLFWAMHYVGLHNVSILDGGLNNWIKQGYELTQKTIEVKKTNFKVTLDPSKIADLDYVKEHLGKLPMIDARPSDKYLGITPTATVERDGHIQGAMSYSWNYSVNEDFTLKSIDQLDALFKDGYKLDKNKEVLVYCTGGLETSYNYFVLSGVLGYKHVRLYDASMKQWGNRKDTPMNKYNYEMFE